MKNPLTCAGEGHSLSPEQPSCSNTSSHAGGITVRSQICQCETRWAGKRCAQAPLIIFNFPRGAGGTFLCPPSSCSAEGGPGQPPVPTHTHTHNPHPAVETRFSSGGTQPRRRTSRVHRRYETPPGRARGRGRAPRSRCAAGPRLTPSPPCQPSAGPCRSGRNQTPPLRPACGAARLGSAQHSTARHSAALLTLAIVCAAVPAARGGRRGGCPRC